MRRKSRYVKDPQDVMGGYKYLKPHQIKARLEIFKKNNCADCDKRYQCDYDMYLKCKGRLAPVIDGGK